MIFSVEQLREAVEYAPPSGPTAPDLRGVLTNGGHLVCARCTGRIVARGLGHFVRGESLWHDRPGAEGWCVVCGKGV